MVEVCNCRDELEMRVGKSALRCEEVVMKDREMRNKEKQLIDIYLKIVWFGARDDAGRSMLASDDFGYDESETIDVRAHPRHLDLRIN